MILEVRCGFQQLCLGYHVLVVWHASSASSFTSYIKFLVQMCVVLKPCKQLSDPIVMYLEYIAVPNRGYSLEPNIWREYFRNIKFPVFIGVLDYTVPDMGTDSHTFGLPNLAKIWLSPNCVFALTPPAPAGPVLPNLNHVHICSSKRTGGHSFGFYFSISAQK